MTGPRGLAAGVIENALTRMRETWGTLEADAAAWIGPAIGPCCYEVGAEVGGGVVVEVVGVHDMAPTARTSTKTCLTWRRV